MKSERNRKSKIQHTVSERQPGASAHVRIEN